MLKGILRRRKEISHFPSQKLVLFCKIPILYASDNFFFKLYREIFAKSVLFFVDNSTTPEMSSLKKSSTIRQKSSFVSTVSNDWRQRRYSVQLWETQYYDCRHETSTTKKKGKRVIQLIFLTSVFTLFWELTPHLQFTMEEVKSCCALENNKTERDNIKSKIQMWQHQWFLTIVNYLLMFNP